MTSCAHCGQPITITHRNPNRRYCSPRCRVADWHARHDRPHRAPSAENAVPNGGTTNAVPGVVPEPNAVPNGANGVPAANGEQRCPHCHQPLAIISVIVPAAAAHIPTPEVIPMDPR